MYFLLSKINTQNIIIMGDFNLPNIDWGKNAITPNSGYSSIAASKLLTIYICQKRTNFHRQGDAGTASSGSVGQQQPR